MTREELIRNLKYTMKKHKNDTVNTFDTNISVMCKDILDYLDQEPMLDMIKAEIIIKYWDCDLCKYTYDGYFRIKGDINDILQIIDKYKAESEDRHDNHSLAVYLLHNLNSTGILFDREGERMVDKAYLEHIEKDQSYAQLNRIWGQIDALYDLFMWLRHIDTEEITKVDLIMLIEDEIIKRANQYKNEVK